MPPRHAYWTILIDNQPTAFRAHDPEELLPTLNRLREKNQSAVMKWFERGKLFDSRDEARDAGYGQGERRWEGPRPDREQENAPREGSSRARGEGDRPRDRNWRPGGEHRDPRQKYKDAKKAKWNRFKAQVRARQEDRFDRYPETFTPPHGDKLRSRTAPADRRRDEARRDDRRDDRSGDRDRPARDDRARQPRGEWRDAHGERGPSRPHGDKLRSRPPRMDWRRDDDRRAGPRDERRGDWRDRPGRQSGDTRDWRSRPPRDSGRPRDLRDRPRDDPREQRDWRNRPQRDAEDRRDWRDPPWRTPGDRGEPRGRPPQESGDRRDRRDRPPRGTDRPWNGGDHRRDDRGGYRTRGDARSGRKPKSAGEKPKPSRPGGRAKPWGKPPKRRRDDDE